MVSKVCIGLVFVLITGTITSISVLKMQNAELKTLRQQLATTRAQLKEYQSAKKIDHDVDAASDSAITIWMRKHSYITD